MFLVALILVDRASVFFLDGLGGRAVGLDLRCVVILSSESCF